MLHGLNTTHFHHICKYVWPWKIDDIKPIVQNSCVCTRHVCNSLQIDAHVCKAAAISLKTTLLVSYMVQLMLLCLVSTSTVWCTLNEVL